MQAQSRKNQPILGTQRAVDPLWRLDEVSAILRRSMCALRRDIKAGRLSCIRIGGRILIENSEVRRIVEASRSARAGGGKK
jgi:hypothetical protein